MKVAGWEREHVHVVSLIDRKRAKAAAQAEARKQKRKKGAS